MALLYFVMNPSNESYEDGNGEECNNQYFHPPFTLGSLQAGKHPPSEVPARSAGFFPQV